MTWHVISRVGAADTFVPEVGKDPRLMLPFERPADPRRLGYDVFAAISKYKDIVVTPRVRDLLVLAMSVYSADLRIQRKTAADGWNREITLYVPVSDVKPWEGAQTVLEQTLCFLTGDTWTLSFRRTKPWPKRKRGKKKIGSVEHFCLFSGGLDSLVGAIDLLSQKGRVALIGHHGAGVTNKVQEDLLAIIEKAYPERIVPLMFYVQPKPRKLKLKDGEPSMRSRSFLFFSLGVAMTASIRGGDTLTVAENGFISLNVPLTPARSGSCSTRTTHPHYVALFRKLLRQLDIDVKITLPYRFKTKGEMLAECEDRSLLTRTAKRSMSCSHPETGRFQGFAPRNHCGYCVPCVIRRAAMRKARLIDPAPNVDVLNETLDHETDTGRDMRAFEMALEREKGISNPQSLFRVLTTGPISPAEAQRCADTYRRGIAEVRKFFKNARKK